MSTVVDISVQRVKQLIEQTQNDSSCDKRVKGWQFSNVLWFRDKNSNGLHE